MKRSNCIDRDSRRNALKGMAALSGAAVVAASTHVSAAETDDHEMQSDSPKALGYQETEHVREYYRLARF